MVKKSEFIWNIGASIISSIIGAILLLFCTRINGIEVAGIFSIGFATSSILNAIGDYGFRAYQVTDIKRKYSFGEYIASRIIVVTFMFLIALVFVAINRYKIEKLLLCVILVLYRVIDNLSETYQGEFQIQGRLDIGSKSVIYRNIFALLVFFIIDIITKNIIISSISMLLTNLIVFILYDLNKIKKYTEEKPKFNKKVVSSLIKECFPVCISTLLNLYLANAIKYAIDRNGTYDMQTYYNIIFLPTFTINLASTFVIRPMFKSFGEYWTNVNIKKLNKTIFIIIGIIIATTIAIELVCLIIGIPILEVVYGVNLEMYKTDLLILVFSGCFFAISNLMLNIITTIRQQKKATVIYIIVSALALFICNIFVSEYQMRGASISNVIITAVLAILLSLIYAKEVYIKSKENKVIEK